MIQGIIFDYGATLDTGGLHWGQLLWLCFQKAGIPIQEEHFRQAYVQAERTLGHTAMIKTTDNFSQTLITKLELEFSYLIDNHYIDRESIQIHQWKQQVFQFAMQHVHEHMNKSRKILSTLRKKYPLALVSNFYGNIEQVLDEFNIKEMFNFVAESAQVGIRKPDPALFQLAIDALNLQASQVAVIGDSLSKDMIPAHSLGCYTVWLKGKGWKEETIDSGFCNEIITDLGSISILNG